MADVKTHVNFTCGICNTSLTDEPSYTRHLKIHDMKTECSVCKKPFKTLKSRTRHYFAEHKGVALNCKSCDVVYNHIGAMDKHKSFHSKKLPYICLICLRAFGTVVYLKKHYQTHQSELLKIIKTNEVFECSSGEEEQMNDDKHLPEGFKCDVCEKTFSTRYSLLNHSLIHEQYGIYKCECCSKIFKTKYAIIQHIKHGVLVKPKEDKNKNGRRRVVMKIKSEKIKSSVCEKCGKIYKDPRRLMLHRKTHQPPEHHPCHICGKVFPYAERLRHHLYIHKNKEIRTDANGKLITYDCKFCEKKFNCRKACSIHQQIHTENYTCTFCGKSFNKKWNLKTHVAIHLGDKPYSCSYCGAKYTDRSNLTKHIAKHPAHVEAKAISDNVTNALNII